MYSSTSNEINKLAKQEFLKIGRTSFCVCYFQLFLLYFVVHGYDGSWLVALVCLPIMINLTQFCHIILTRFSNADPVFSFSSFIVLALYLVLIFICIYLEANSLFWTLILFLASFLVREEFQWKLPVVPESTKFELSEVVSRTLYEAAVLAIFALSLAWTTSIGGAPVASFRTTFYWQVVLLLPYRFWKLQSTKRPNLPKEILWCALGWHPVGSAEGLLCSYTWDEGTLHIQDKQHKSNRYSSRQEKVSMWFHSRMKFLHNKLDTPEAFRRGMTRKDYIFKQVIACVALEQVLNYCKFHKDELNMMINDPALFFQVFSTCTAVVDALTFRLVLAKACIKKGFKDDAKWKVNSFKWRFSSLIFGFHNPVLLCSFQSSTALRSDFGTAAILENPERFSISVEILSRIICASRSNDKVGIVQDTITASIHCLLTCRAEMGDFFGLEESVCKIERKRVIAIVNNALDRALHQIISAFYKDLKEFSISPELKSQLESYIEL